jgi:hypothetical protein
MSSSRRLHARNAHWMSLPERTQLREDESLGFLGEVLRHAPSGGRSWEAMG